MLAVGTRVKILSIDGRLRAYGRVVGYEVLTAIRCPSGVRTTVTWPRITTDAGVTYTADPTGVYAVE